MRQMMWNKYYLGQTAEMSRVFTWEDVEACARLTGDNNPMYFDRAYVARTKLKRPVVQALLTEGLVTALLNGQLPGPGALLLEKEFVFRHPVHVGDKITARVQVIDIDPQRHWITEKVVCTNQHQQEVLRGQVVLLVESGIR
ncbi:MAG: MaoC family dehydratase [Bacillota bacterium]|nr:enoyl-CoA hydratase [Bacillota bacterium]